ncbi:hypothetical protein L202_07389 [Cryptococcus amylolentus CBS 6039]|uniref:Alginate lyase domain-containing protein n=1 Tax=Cryptococcus amylolentus CBS 6039 TaxID=1295533 RepID=A0A1E3HC14_9TREE|nr:hypothetical protein L202_07389 [Cryptococcus amylolentus CBS 6039]ODN73873.1 hypothetical protein L202_07389 [Cryptococcus amylolentus CBS 6039]
MVVFPASWLLAGFCVLPLATAYPASANTTIEDHSLSSSLSSSGPESTSSGALHSGQDRPRFMSHDTPSDHYPLDSIWWQASSHHIPRTVVLDGCRLADAKIKLEEGDKEMQEVLDNLLRQANIWMEQGPWTVVANSKSVPNGTNHDYASQAPYWWANNWNDTSSNETCPYVQRDGVVNPESLEYTSHQDRLSMFTASYTLALAWYYTDNPYYRAHAADILRTWFITNSTAMTPHLNHSQIIPCANDGRAIGVIDFSQQYTDVLDTAAILSTVYDATWNSGTEAVFREWNTEYLAWLTDSAFGKTELAAANNHGAFARLQIAGVAAYVGQYELARSMTSGTKALIDNYITANGSQPLELARTRSWHYTCFDLVAYTRLADIGVQLGVDLWGYEGPDGQSILGAIDFLIPYATGNQTWPYPELSFFQYAPSDSINAAADQGDEAAKAAVPYIAYSPSTGNQWPLRPSAEQLDNIASTG